MDASIKYQWKIQYRNVRIARRRVEAKANREAGLRAWADNWTLLRRILNEESEKLSAIAIADCHMDRFGPESNEQESD